MLLVGVVLSSARVWRHAGRQSKGAVISQWRDSRELQQRVKPTLLAHMASYNKQLTSFFIEDILSIREEKKTHTDAPETRPDSRGSSTEDEDSLIISTSDRTPGSICSASI